MAVNETEISTAVKTRIMPGLADGFFKNDPMLQFLKRDRYFPWTGSDTIQENLIYDSANGGPFVKGETFDTSQKQTKTGVTFGFREYYVNSTLFKEDIDIIIRGPQAAFNKVSVDLGICALTMAGKLACALYSHGQNMGGVNDRSKHINGFEEALADGVNNTYEGLNFTTYGNQARADINGAANSPVGAQAANVNGAINYSVLARSYASCIIGEEHPVMGVTTNRCWAFLNENFSPQQRIDTKEPTIGYTGLKFMDATIVVSQYCPGQDITAQDATKLGAVQATAETFWWLNPGSTGDDALIRLYMSNNPDYQFGFTGYKVRQDSTNLAGQILFAGNLTVRQPRLMRCLFGITA